MEVPAGRWGAAPSWDPGATLPALWADRWRAHPDSVVLREGRGDGRGSDGATLERRTAAMAALLVARGVRPGDRVLWRAGSTLASVESLLAVLRAGAVLVPVLSLIHI